MSNEGTVAPIMLSANGLMYHSSSISFISYLYFVKMYRVKGPGKQNGANSLLVVDCKLADSQL